MTVTINLAWLVFARHRLATPESDTKHTHSHDTVQNSIRARTNTTAKNAAGL